MNPPARTPLAARILDATLTECLLHPPSALDVHDLETITEHLPLAHLPGAVPVPPRGSPGAEAFAFVTARAHVIEPITWDAYDSTRAEDAQILVDPEGVPLDAPPLAHDRRAGPRHEHVAWTLPRATAQETLDAIAGRLKRLAPDERLRVRDPHGRITPALAHALAGLAQAERLTLHLEDATGLALAAALTAVNAGPAGLLVRTTLLGLGPRTGVPATERLVALVADPEERPTHLEGLQHAARAVLAAFHTELPATHPFWGARRDEAAEPERLRGGGPVRVNPATLPHVLDEHLAAWGITLPPQARDELLARLASALRPGERLEGPVLWALVAQHLDPQAIGASRRQT